MTARPRKLQFAVAFVSFLLAAIPLYPLTILTSWVIQMIMDPFLPLSGSWISLSLLVIAGYVVFFRVCPAVFHMWLSSIRGVYNAIEPRIIDRQRKMADRYRMPQYPSNQILSVPAENDEVNIWLKVLAFPVSLLFWLVQPIGVTVNVTIMVLLLARIVGGAVWHIRDDLGTYFLLMFLGGGGLLGGLLLVIGVGLGWFLLLVTAIVFAIALCSWIEALLLQPILWLVPVLFRGSPIAFGWEGMTTNWLLNVGVSSRPPAGSSSVLDPTVWGATGARRLGLHHAVHKQPTAIKEVAKWLARNSRSAAVIQPCSAQAEPPETES